MLPQFLLRAATSTTLSICLVVAGCGRADPDAARATRYQSDVLEAAPSMSMGMEAPADSVDAGIGPGQGGDKYEPIVENAFLRVTDHPLSTFSIDVDTASYS